jgi:hypothetical protein
MTNDKLLVIANQRVQFSAPAVVAVTYNGSSERRTHYAALLPRKVSSSSPGVSGSDGGLSSIGAAFAPLFHVLSVAALIPYLIVYLFSVVYLPFHAA